MTLSKEPCRSRASGKELTRYRDLGEAKSQANGLLHKYGKKLYPYECQKCNYWHLSNRET